MEELRELEAELGDACLELDEANEGGDLEDRLAAAHRVASLESACRRLRSSGSLQS